MWIWRHDIDTNKTGDMPVLTRLKCKRIQRRKNANATVEPVVYIKKYRVSNAENVKTKQESVKKMRPKLP